MLPSFTALHERRAAECAVQLWVVTLPHSAADASPQSVGVNFVDDPGSGVAAEAIASAIVELERADAHRVERHVLFLTPFDCEHRRRANQPRTAAEYAASANRKTRFDPICVLCASNAVAAVPRVEVDFNRDNPRTNEFVQYVRQTVARGRDVLSRKCPLTKPVDVCTLDVHTCLESSFRELKEDASRMLAQRVHSDAIVLLLPFLGQRAESLQRINECIQECAGVGELPVCAGQGSDVNMLINSDVGVRRPVLVEVAVSNSFVERWRQQMNEGQPENVQLPTAADMCIGDSRAALLAAALQCYFFGRG